MEIVLVLIVSVLTLFTFWVHRRTQKKVSRMVALMNTIKHDLIDMEYDKSYFDADTEILRNSHDGEYSDNIQESLNIGYCWIIINGRSITIEVGSEKFLLSGNKCNIKMLQLKKTKGELDSMKVWMLNSKNTTSVFEIALHKGLPATSVLESFDVLATLAGINLYDALRKHKPLI